MRTPAAGRNALTRKEFLAAALTGASAISAATSDSGADNAPRAPVESSYAEGAAPRSASPLAAPDRIILLIIDTLRSDHVGCYGYFRDTTPFLDFLAANGTLFQRATASCSMTSPSHASLFTSLHPIQHKVVFNGLMLEPRFLTMAEFLQQQGYATAGFVSTIHFLKAGMARGFDTFSCRGDEGLVDNLYRPAEATVDKALAWLTERKPDEKFFLWVHVFDPHGPLKPPEEYSRPFDTETEQDFEKATRTFLFDHHTDFEFWKHKRNYLLGHMNRYDGEVRYADVQLQRLYTAAEQNGLNKNALWIATADHGEGLGNHHFGAHDRFIYNETVRVPLVFHGDGLQQGRRVVDDVVELVDIFPTLGSLLGVKLSDLVPHAQGECLLPYCVEASGSSRQKRTGFSERRAYVERQRPGPDDDMAFYHFEEGDKYALQDEHYKYIYWTVGDDEFYDLMEDPYELKNVRGLGVPEERHMRKELHDRVAAMRQHFDVEPAQADEQDMEQLRALGYLL
ncbi:MAG TPA: hypothetical protein ENN80_14480 [Candidatus Hydrogenedentes bacterium]|nr:hypothetical protein [Candidatus Hydrogenedentota bacterium]